MVIQTFTDVIEQIKEHSIQNVKCPVCQSDRFLSFISAYISPDNVETFSFLSDQKFFSCERCGTFLKVPLHVNKVDVQDYGKSYYNQIHGEDNILKTIYNHICSSQMAVYKTFQEILEAKFSAEEYPNWLDIGSAGYPTMFEHYNFITIEPDPRAVLLGKALFNGEKIICNVFEKYESSTRVQGIVFHHSFYCLPDPSAILKKAFDVLEDNGVLVIAISQFFVETSAPSKDKAFQRLEDIFRGVTSYCYYNAASLEYLLNQNGFVLESSDIKSHKESSLRDLSESQYFFFRKQAHITQKPELIEMSKSYNALKMEQLFQAWEDVTCETLKKINHEKTVIIGDSELFFDLTTYAILDKIDGFIDEKLPTDNPFTLNGIKHYPLKYLKELVGKDIVICAFDKRQETLVALLQTLNVMAANRVLIPSRQSAIKRFHMEYRQQKVPTKAFVLVNLLFDEDKYFVYAQEIKKRIGHNKKVAIFGIAQAGKIAFEFAKEFTLDVECFIDDFHKGYFVDTLFPVVNRETSARFKETIGVIIKGPYQKGLDEPSLHGIPVIELS